MAATKITPRDHKFQIGVEPTNRCADLLFQTTFVETESNGYMPKVISLTSGHKVVGEVGLEPTSEDYGFNYRLHGGFQHYPVESGHHLLTPTSTIPSRLPKKWWAPWGSNPPCRACRARAFNQKTRHPSQKTIATESKSVSPAVL